MYPFSQIQGEYDQIKKDSVMVLGGWRPMENLSSCLQYNITDNTINFITKPNNFPAPTDED